MRQMSGRGLEKWFPLSISCWCDTHHTRDIFLVWHTSTRDVLLVWHTRACSTYVHVRFVPWFSCRNSHIDVYVRPKWAPFFNHLRWLTKPLALFLLVWPVRAALGTFPAGVACESASMACEYGLWEREVWPVRARVWPASVLGWPSMLLREGCSNLGCLDPWLSTCFLQLCATRLQLICWHAFRLCSCGLKLFVAHLRTYSWRTSQWVFETVHSWHVVNNWRALMNLARMKMRQMAGYMSVVMASTIVYSYA